MPAGDDRIGVLWLTKGLGPGGAERLLVSMARAADHQRFRYEAAYLLPEKDHLVAELAAAGVPARCLDGPRELDLRWTARLRRLLVDRRYDVVHVHAPYVAAAARMVVRTVPRRPRLLYTEHNTWAGYGRATRWANAVTYPLDDARVVVSPDARRSLPARWRRGTELVVHGIDLGRVRDHRGRRQELRAALGLPAGAVVVGTVANLRRHKDYPTLLRAASAALRSEADLRFLAVGQGPLESELRALHDALGLDDRFRFLGYRADPLEVLAACDVFVLSSIAEGYPVALMEALGLGLPVVATAVGGVPDAVRPGVEGLLVPPSHPDRLADAILALSRDPARRADMGAAAAARAELFDIRRATSRIEEIYVELVARRQQRP